MLSNCRIVLVRTHYAGNLGSVARAMKNFGLRDLVLVAPYASVTDVEARQMAVHGLNILESARVVDTLPEALEGCQLVLATTSNVWGLVRNHSYGRPDEQMPQLVKLLPSGPGAIVFGPEPSGLTSEDIALCHGIIRIPADPEYPSLNLAQSSVICLYELRKAWLTLKHDGMKPSQPVAPYQDQERMFQHLRQALEEVHFLFGTKADSLFYAIRHLIARAQPSPNEVRIWHGLARQLRWFARHGTRLPGEEESSSNPDPSEDSLL